MGSDNNTQSQLLPQLLPLDSRTVKPLNQRLLADPTPQQLVSTVIAIQSYGMLLTIELQTRVWMRKIQHFAIYKSACLHLMQIISATNLVTFVQKPIRVYVYTRYSLLFPSTCTLLGVGLGKGYD